MKNYKNRKKFVYVAQTSSGSIISARVYRVKGPGHHHELIGLAPVCRGDRPVASVAGWLRKNHHIAATHRLGEHYDILGL